jgi:hypothetical protein
MRKVVQLVTACLFASFPFSLVAGTFDGSKPLICAPTDVHECVRGSDCIRRTVAEVDAPDFFRIDFKKKTLTSTRQATNQRTTKIERSETVDGKLILQGVEDGRKDIRDGLGWSLSIAEPSGRMVMTASGENEAFVIFGACTPD